MYGAILGDIIGSPYEFDVNNIKTKDFPLFSDRSEFTDDTVMTLAVAEALLDALENKVEDDDTIKEYLVEAMKKWGHKYPHSGYGARFIGWLENGSEPYNSFGNGSAMRVSSAGWLYGDLETTRRMARLTSEPTHNHPEGIKGAEAIASAIYLARTGSSKEDIKNYITKEFDYDLSRTCDEIRPAYRHVESCQETVPEAITAFLEGESFEDVMRLGVSLGGDSDTLTCIAGSVAEAYFGVPEELVAECRERLTEDLLEVVDRFRRKHKRMNIRPSQLTDIPRIMDIFAYARSFMAANGNPNQWGRANWPPEDLIRKDIEQGLSYVCLNHQGEVIGTFFFNQGKDIEPTYAKIYDGAWLDDSPYGIIHRIAGDGSEKGIGAFCINWAYDQCGHMRIDTHSDNIVMQNLLTKLGFTKCGIIYIEKDNDPRIAYEKCAYSSPSTLITE